MREELELSPKNFESAVERLVDLRHKSGEPDVLRDATIQRFEFTYELCWKTLKFFLNEKGVLCSTPKECFQKALQNGLIAAEQEGLYLSMIQDRNLTSHVYREKTADEVYARVKKDHISLLKSVAEKLTG